MANGTWNWKEFREHPAMITLSTIVLFGSALTGYGIISGAYNAAHTSEEELAVYIGQVEELQSSVEEYSDVSKCQYLSLRINAVEDQIYQMEQSGQNSQRLVEKRRELRDLIAQYQSLRCASKL